MKALRKWLAWFFKPTPRKQRPVYRSPRRTNPNSTVNNHYYDDCHQHDNTSRFSSGLDCNFNDD